MTLHLHFLNIGKPHMVRLLLVLSGFTIELKAQEQIELSLQKAIEIGVQQRFDLKGQRLQMQISDNDIKKQNSKNLPQITATADFRYYTQLQTNILPGSVFGGGPDKPIQFGLPYNNNIALNLKQNIYDANTNFDRKISKTTSESEKLKLDQNIIDVKLTIAQSYYNVLLNQEKFNLSQANLTRNSINYSTAKQKADNGNLIKSDFDRFRLDFQNAKISVQKDSSNLELSKMDLLNQLNMKQGITVLLTDNLEAMNQEIIPEFEGMQGERIEIKREKMQMTVNEFNVKKQEYSYFPTVQFYANYTFQQLSRDFKFFNSSTWFPYNYLGVQVNIPIFDGLLKSRTRSEFMMKKQINQNNIDKLKSDISYELQSAYATLQNAYRTMKYTRENYDQAKDLVVVYQTKFKEGSTLNSDLLNTQYSLQTAQNNLMNAYYDYLLAKLKWQKAKGEL